MAELDPGRLQPRQVQLAAATLQAVHDGHVQLRHGLPEQERQVRADEAGPAGDQEILEVHRRISRVVAGPAVRELSSARGHRLEDLVDDPGQVVGLLPDGVVRLELAGIADVPDVVADPVGLVVDQVHLLAGAGFAEVDRLFHRAIAEPAAAGVVDLAGSGGLVVLPEHVDQVERVDVVAYLLPAITEHGIPAPRHGALDQIREESVHHGARVARAGQTAAAEAGGVHAEVAAVLLDHGVGGELRDAEQRVLGLVDRQILVDPVLVVRMGLVDLPARRQLDQRQTVGVVAVDLVGRGEDEAGPGSELTRRFEQVERAVGVDAEVGVGILRRPVVRRLGRRVHDQLDVGAVLGEQGLDPLAIPDVDLAMGVVRDRRFQVATAPLGRGIIAEELSSHVVVDPDDMEPLRAEEPNRLRAD